MENFENKAQDESSFNSTTAINSFLMETSKWGKFLAIVGYIGMGLMIIIAIFMMFGLSKISSLAGKDFPVGFMGFTYIIFAAIYFFPINYLYQYSAKIKQGLISKDITTISSGFENLKSLFKFFGIFTIVVLSIYGLILLIAIPMMLFR